MKLATEHRSYALLTLLGFIMFYQQIQPSWLLDLRTMLDNPIRTIVPVCDNDLIPGGMVAIDS